MVLGRECLLFINPNYPSCLAVATIIEEVCKHSKYDLKIINVENSNEVGLISKYHISMLPTYVFLENDGIVYVGIGTTPRHVIEKNLRKQ
jgi:hypothetical protein